eukprot:9495458-Pyramimonas_sp.AAC.1
MGCTHRAQAWRLGRLAEKGISLCGCVASAEALRETGRGRPLGSRGWVAHKNTRRRRGNTRMP